MRLVTCSCLSFVDPSFSRRPTISCSSPYGSHADEIETSLMLTIAPSLVDLARAKPSPLSAERPTPGTLSPNDRTSPNYSPSGSFGDATLASIDKARDCLRLFCKT
jgi:creatinine amidohydrolase